MTEAVRRVLELVERASPRDARRARRALCAIEAAPESVRPRLLHALVVLEPALAHVVTCSYRGPLCPAYPDAAPAFAARLALGERPDQVLRGLSRREAHDALRAGVDPVAWICRAVDPALSRPRSVPVARWLSAVWRDPARRESLLRARVERAGGAEVHGRFADRVDEIVPADLARGEKTSVPAAFRAAASRLYEQWSALHEHDASVLAPTPRWWRPIRCARLLLSRAALVREGREQQHCAGTYAPIVARGDSVLLSILVRDGRGKVHRSTAEIDRESRLVRQHKGRRNGAPPVLCERALDVCLRRWEQRRENKTEKTI